MFVHIMQNYLNKIYINDKLINLEVFLHNHRVTTFLTRSYLKKYIYRLRYILNTLRRSKDIFNHVSIVESIFFCKAITVNV